MRSVFLFCLIVAVFASCSVSERELKRAADAGDFSFAAEITQEIACKAAAKDPETPLFLALKMLALAEKSPETDRAAYFLLTAAAGLSRDSSGLLCVDARLQQKIPFLNRATALFRLCSLARQSAAEHPADYSGRPLSAAQETLRADILFLEDVLDGKTDEFLLPALDGEEYPLSSLSGFEDAESALSEALVLTHPLSSSSTLAENEAAALRRLVLERHYNAAAALFFRVAERLGYEGEGYSLAAMEDVLPLLDDEGEMSEADENLLLTRDFLSAAGRALLYSEAESANSASALEYLLALPLLSGGGQAREARYVLKFYLARIRAKMPESSSEALAMMESSLADAPTDEDRDFSLWYMLDIARGSGNEPLLDLIEARISEWHDPEVFSDILTRLISDLAAEHDVEALLRLEAVLPVNAPARIRERAAFSAALLLPAGSSGERERLETLAESAESLYYRIRSAELLGEKHEILRQNRGAPRKANAADVPAEFAGEAMALIRASIDWNLFRQAAAFADDFPFARFSDVQGEAQKLMKPGRYSEAMRLLSASFSHLGPEAVRIESASRETLEMLYPQLWLAEVEAAAAATQEGEDAALGALPETLIFAVIRQESFFDPDAVSHAGAKGLMQLMDATAAEVAEKLNVPDYNLFSPETSIRFGSFYLSEMKRRLEGESLQAVCAYNAGIGRVRRWLSDFPPQLPGKGAAAEECIFIEAVPFNETRDYAKRVFTSAAVYSALYYESR